MSREQALPVVSMAGKSGVAKTTALKHIVRELKRRGYRMEKIEIANE